MEMAKKTCSITIIFKINMFPCNCSGFQYTNYLTGHQFLMKANKMAKLVLLTMSMPLVLISIFLIYKFILLREIILFIIVPRHITINQSINKTSGVAVLGSDLYTTLNYNKHSSLHSNAQSR